LSNRYDFFEKEDGYGFITSCGIEYTIYFTQSSNFFEEYPSIYPYVIEFGFCRNDKRKNSDPKIKETIVFILELYFEKNPDGMIYFVCDSADKKHCARNKIFDNWFNQIEEGSRFVKYDFMPEIKGRDFYFSLITLESNRFLIQQLNLVLDSLKAKVDAKYSQIF